MSRWRALSSTTSSVSIRLPSSTAVRQRLLLLLLLTGSLSVTSASNSFPSTHLIPSIEHHPVFVVGGYTAVVIQFLIIKLITFFLRSSPRRFTVDRRSSVASTAESIHDDDERGPAAAGDPRPHRCRLMSTTHRCAFIFPKVNETEALPSDSVAKNVRGKYRFASTRRAADLATHSTGTGSTHRCAHRVPLIGWQPRAIQRLSHSSADSHTRLNLSYGNRLCVPLVHRIRRFQTLVVPATVSDHRILHLTAEPERLHRTMHKSKRVAARATDLTTRAAAVEPNVTRVVRLVNEAIPSEDVESGALEDPSARCRAIRRGASLAADWRTGFISFIVYCAYSN